MPLGQVNVVSESESKPLEVWVAEDSPFYRLVVEEAIEEIVKVTYLPISLTVFERFGDVRTAFDQAERGMRSMPSAVLSDLHFPDNAHEDLQDILVFYSRYVHAVPVSYMSCNRESLELAESHSEQRSDALQAPRFCESQDDGGTSPRHGPQPGPGVFVFVCVAGHSAVDGK